MHTGAAGCHDLGDYIGTLYEYLTCEWDSKLLEQDQTCVPCTWTQQNPGQQVVFNSTTLPHRTLDVPVQRNNCDCGLFVLTYMDFRTGAMTDQSSANGQSAGSVLLKQHMH